MLIEDPLIVRAVDYTLHILCINLHSGCQRTTNNRGNKGRHHMHSKTVARETMQEFALTQC